MFSIIIHNGVSSPSVIVLPASVLCPVLSRRGIGSRTQGFRAAFVVLLLLSFLTAAGRFNLKRLLLMAANIDGIYFTCQLLKHSVERAMQAFKLQLLAELKHLNIILKL